VAPWTPAFAEVTQKAGSIEHVITKMTPAERLARAEQLLVDAERHLPLLEQVETELGASRQDEVGEVLSTAGSPADPVR
jgi:hypothetical protein